MGVGLCSSVIPYVTDQLAMARLPCATSALMLAILPATATGIGLLVLARLPCATSALMLAILPATATGIGLLVLAQVCTVQDLAGIAWSSPASPAPGPRTGPTAARRGPGRPTRRRPHRAAGPPVNRRRIMAGPREFNITQLELHERRQLLNRPREEDLTHPGTRRVHLAAQRTPITPRPTVVVAA